MKATKKMISEFQYSGEELSFEDSFKAIINDKIKGYDNPVSFFEDLRQGGCISGLIGEFIYNADCKTFYIEHIDDLEWMIEDMEYCMGEPIKNRHKLPRYVFACHLCFEEYCYRMHDQIFENN